MIYGDRGYCIAHAHSRPKEALGRVPRSRGRDDQAKDEHSGASERLGTSNAGRGMPAVRPRWLRRAP
jgi:hypothetical protein